jgi:transposase
MTAANLATRKAYDSDVTDEEWAFCVQHLTLMREDAVQRMHPLREIFNGLRWITKTGSPWRSMPHDLPPWHTVHQQAMRWIEAGCFEAMAHDLRKITRLALGHAEEPTMAILDGRTMQSTPESGERAGYDGYKRRNGSKVHVAVDKLGHMLAIVVKPANEQERDQVKELTEKIQEVTNGSVEIGVVDQGYTGDAAAEAALENGVILQVVKHTEAKRGFVLLPRRWVVERTFGWMSRFRRLARDYERKATTLAGLHWLAATTLALSALFR